MSAVVWSVPLPSGRTVEVREVTMGDLEEVGLDWDKLARRALVTVDGVEDNKAGRWPVLLRDYSAVLAWVQARVNPTPEQMQETSRQVLGDGGSVTVALNGRIVTLSEPDVETWQTVTKYGTAKLKGDLGLLRRCVTRIDDRPVSYADLLGARWPFAVWETLILHYELVRLISEPVDEREARESRAQGIARAVATPRA